MDYKHNSLNLAQFGHYLFLEAHSFPRASLSENCSLLGTDNVRGQISEHIFAQNEGYCLFIKFSTSDNAFRVFWLVRSILVISSYTLVWPYMVNDRLSVAKLKMFSPESEIFLWIKPKKEKKTFLWKVWINEVRETARNVFCDEPTPDHKVLHNIAS